MQLQSSATIFPRAIPRPLRSGAWLRAVCPPPTSSFQGHYPFNTRGPGRLITCLCAPSASCGTMDGVPLWSLHLTMIIHSHPHQRWVETGSCWPRPGLSQDLLPQSQLFVLCGSGDIFFMFLSCLTNSMAPSLRTRTISASRMILAFTARGICHYPGYN